MGAVEMCASKHITFRPWPNSLKIFNCDIGCESLHNLIFQHIIYSTMAADHREEEKSVRK